MATLTVKYDNTNQFAHQFIELMHTSGVFEFAETPNSDISEDEEKEAFLLTSRINASKTFAKYL